MRRLSLVLVAAAILVASFVVGAQVRVGGDDGPTGGEVTRLTELPRGATRADVLELNATVMNATPAPIREAFAVAAREGIAEYEVTPQERDQFFALVRQAARDQGRTSWAAFDVDGILFSTSSSISN